MSKPNDNQLVFTLPEALSEIRALRDERDEIRSMLREMKKSLSEVSDDLQSVGGAGQYACECWGKAIADALEPANEYLL